MADPAAMDSNPGGVADSARKVILPPGFRKSNRRERLLPSNPIPIQPAHTTLPTNRDVNPHLPRHARTAVPDPPDRQDNPGHPSASSTDNDRIINDPQQIAPSARAVPVSPAPVAITPRSAFSLAPVTQSRSTHHQVSTSPPIDHPFSEVGGAVDDITRAQLHEWYLRSGSMEQGLRALKKKRDRK